MQTQSAFFPNLKSPVKISRQNRQNDLDDYKNSSSIFSKFENLLDYGSSLNSSISSFFVFLSNIITYKL